MQISAIIVSLLLAAAPLSAKYLEVEESPLKETLIHISEDTLPVQDLTIKERLAPDDIAESGGASTIYFVYDGKKPVAVIKKYPLDDTRFESEYLIMTELNTLSFKEFNAVRLIGTSEDDIDGEKAGFLVESVAPGKSLNRYLQEISKAWFGKRQALFSELNRGVEKTALALAELHSKKSFSKTSEYYENRYANIAEAAGQKPPSSIPGPFGYIHGDSHLGNIFYDSEGDKAYFIDFSSTYASRNGGPIGQDVANVLLTLELLGSYYELSPKEISSLQDTFLTAYQQNGPQVSDETIAFYRHYFLLIYTTQFNDEDIDQAHHFYTYCKTKLEHENNN